MQIESKTTRVSEKKRKLPTAESLKSQLRIWPFIMLSLFMAVIAILIAVAVFDLKKGIARLPPAFDFFDVLHVKLDLFADRLVDKNRRASRKHQTAQQRHRNSKSHGFLPVNGFWSSGFPLHHRIPVYYFPARLRNNK